MTLGLLGIPTPFQGHLEVVHLAPIIDIITSPMHKAL
jgi:hypothetical protein